MKRRTVALAAALALVAPLVVAAAVSTPHAPVTVSLPDDLGIDMRPGPGVGAARQYCLGCHSAAYVTTQPPLTSAQWSAEVAKMRTAYGARIPDDQIGPIAAYLTAEYGR